MNKLQEYFAIYLDCYVNAVVRGKEEYFLSFCDVEEELLEEFNGSDWVEYCVIVVNNRDYSEAVRKRNEADAAKIVLLSGEGIKQIDSLKDFNEYPILAEEKRILWSCLKASLGLASITDSAQAFLSVILEHSEVSLSTLMKYLDSSVRISKVSKTVSGVLQKGEGGKVWTKRKILSPEKLNANLPMLGMWKSRKTSYLNKGETGRILRASRYSVVESRLTKAVMNRKMAGLKIEKPITDGLASNSIESIFKRVFYEDVKDFLKAPVKNPPSEDARSAVEEEVLYENSYQCYLLTDSGKTVTDIEAEWLADKEREDSDEEQEWFKYQCGEEELGFIKEQYGELLKAIREMNLEEAMIREIECKLLSLQMLFMKSWNAVSQATPICLDKFCVSAYGYAQEYMQLLAFFLKDNKVRAAVVGTEVIQRIQLLFCHVEGATVKMPFYHPICVFYYMCVRKMYQFVIGEQKKDGRDFLNDRIWLAMIQRTMQFPIEYMTVDGKGYALDYATVWQSGSVLFENQDFGTVYSLLDFRMISRQVLEYLEGHPFLTHIKIAVIDISSLTGLVQLVNRILHFSRQSWCNIGRVDFLILSAREEELKKEIADAWDNIGTENIIRFRFGRNRYWDGSRYCIETIIEESDITIIADNSMLYREPRMTDYSNNGFKNRLEERDLDGQVERYFAQYSPDIAVIWDSLQYAAKNREDGYRIWKNREIDNGILANINRMISDTLDKAIILLSSNEHILSEIFRTQYIHVHQGGYNSRNITIIEFQNNNQRKLLSDEGEPKIGYSLREFYDRMLGLEELPEYFSEFLEDILLEFGYQDEGLYCSYQLVIMDGDDSDREWKSQCLEWIQWQIKKLTSNENILGIYFRDILLHFLLEQAVNLPSVLLLERLFMGDFQSVLGEISGSTVVKKESKTKNKAGAIEERDYMEALKMHEIIAFIRSKAGIDEQAVGQFRERYETEFLGRLINCNAIYNLLPEEDSIKLQKIYERILE